MTAYRRRSTGRSPPCINSDNTDYKEHRMRTVYMRASMIDGRRERNSRSMQPVGYYCLKCEKFWTDDDRMHKIVERASREAVRGGGICAQTQQ